MKTLKEVMLEAVQEKKSEQQKFDDLAKSLGGLYHQKGMYSSTHLHNTNGKNEHAPAVRKHLLSNGYKHTARSTSFGGSSHNDTYRKAIPSTNPNTKRYHQVTVAHSEGGHMGNMHYSEGGVSAY